MSDQITKKIHSFLKSELNLKIPLNAIDLKTGWIFKKQNEAQRDWNPLTFFSIDALAKSMEQFIKYESKDEMISRGLDYIVYKNVIDKHGLIWDFIILVSDGLNVYKGDIVLGSLKLSITSPRNTTK